MESLLIDAGPLIALFNKRDRYHAKMLEFLKNRQATYWTTWPVITEATHLLDFSLNAQISLLKWIERGGLNLVDIPESSVSKILAYCTKYSDVPMDLADATLMVTSEIIGTNKIVSIDSDFYIYRDFRNNYLQNVFL